MPRLCISRNQGRLERAGQFFVRTAMTISNWNRILLPAAALAAVIVAPMVHAQSAPAVAPVRTINHLQIRVTDPKKSYEFYMKLFGGHVISTGGNGNALTMML